MITCMCIDEMFGDGNDVVFLFCWVSMFSFIVHIGCILRMDQLI